MPSDYRIRHQVQPRNRELAELVDRFFEDRNGDQLTRAFVDLSPGERTMVLVYLIANDFSGAARAVAKSCGFDLVDGLARLDRANGREAAEALRWL